ncbi:hypothetical protein GWI33_013263, partial [Rhynchophorus ferrugineus]
DQTDQDVMGRKSCIRRNRVPRAYPTGPSRMQKHVKLSDSREGIWGEISVCRSRCIFYECGGRFKKDPSGERRFPGKAVSFRTD